MNYFELYDLEQNPVVDIKEASKKYTSLQRKYHPDFFTQEDDEAKENAEQMSAAINKAYAVFKDPDKTIAYFLEVNNKLEENEQYKLPPEFLMDMMELNESLAEEDPETIQDKILVIENRLKLSIKPILEKPGKDIKDDELEELKAFHYKKKYVKRVLDRLDD